MAHLRGLRVLATALAILAGIIWVSVVASAATLTVGSMTTSLRTSEETFQVPSGVRGIPKGVAVAGSNLAAAGLTCPGVEASDGYPNLTSTVTQNNYEYLGTIEEPSNGSWPSGRKYKAEVSANGVTIATLYFQNGSASSSKREGVNLHTDLGSATSFPKQVKTVVTQITAC